MSGRCMIRPVYLEDHCRREGALQRELRRRRPVRALVIRSAEIPLYASPRQPYTRPRRRRVVLAVVMLTLVCAVLIAWDQNRNKGKDTTCWTFDHMAASKRREVIRTMGFPQGSSINGLVNEALTTCKGQPDDETLEYVFGP